MIGRLRIIAALALIATTLAQGDAARASGAGAEAGAVHPPEINWTNWKSFRELDSHGGPLHDGQLIVTTETPGPRGVELDVRIVDADDPLAAGLRRTD